MDDAKLPVYVAVPITYLPADTQLLLYHRITQGDCKVDIEKAELLKAKHRSGELTEEMMDGILSGQLLPSKTPKRTAVKIKPVVLKKYFKKGESAKEIEAVISVALEFYFANAKEEEQTSKEGFSDE